MSARHPRGFVLIVVVICSVAMVAIAVALAFTAGANRIVSVKGASIERAETIAVAGMERAIAYAERVAAVERDFDLLLDHENNLNCGSAATTAGGLPRFTDAGVTDVMFNGRPYRAVPFNGGAYLVRFDDDADDFETNPFLAPFTSNRPAGGNCLEGPAFAGRNNIHRDRNRAVWVSVVGVFPGTDPENAPHRVALRRFHVSTQRLPAPAFVVGDDLTAAKGIRFCSAVGDVAAGGDVALGDSSPICGTVMAGGTVSGPIVDAIATCASPDRCAPTGAPAPATPMDPTLLNTLAPSASNGSYGARPASEPPSCDLFAVDVAAGFGGLFFWDRTVPSCATMPVTVGPPTATNVVLPGSCWRPLFLARSSGTIDNVMGWSNVDSSGWSPTSTTETQTASTTPLGPISFPAGYVATQPDWSSCSVRWKGETSPVRCTTCDGSKTVVALVGENVRLDLTTPSAVPAMSLRRGQLVVPEDVVSGAPPSTDASPGWAPVTLLISGNATLSSGSSLGLGFGVAQGAPSLVVDGTLSTSGNATLRTAGSVFVGNDVNFSGTPVFEAFGAVIVKGDFNASGNTTVRQDYQFDVFNLGNLPLVAPATTSRALR